ncbi:protein Atg16l2 isoform X1 [Oryctolagus cuniculus]|uniref:protein Atg16l2 isoform X1 n=1 Tax=Oryctolagus cuniculus TaxID=9986 RepID=UPI0022321B55|nr:protein Atg16l2 isoform X2 [Oryctolagus cuniculus]
MARAGPAGAPAARWKGHIVRQLRQRDRTQKAFFLELVPAYNRLLEKAELLATLSERLQPEPGDVSPAAPPSPWEEESGRGSEQAPRPAALREKWQQEEEELRLVCGEMAYQVVEKSAALGTLEAELEERQSRLAALEARVAQLQEARAQKEAQVEDQRARNAAQRAAYEELRAHAGLQEVALRRLQEEARDLLERLVQRKARAAAERNLRNERRERLPTPFQGQPGAGVAGAEEGCQASCEHQRVRVGTARVWAVESARRPWVTPARGDRSPPPRDVIREGTETVALASGPESLESEACEKWKRPFSFKKRRGHSVGGAPEQRYHSIPVCVAARVPTWAQDALDAHLSEVNAVCFGPNSSLLATGGADHLIHLWNVVGGRLEANQTLEGAGSITSVDFDPSGSQVLAATYNQAAQLWKVGEAQSKETLSGHKDKVTAAKFKLTRHQAVTGSRDRTVKEWDLGRAYCARTINVLSYCNDVVCGDHIIISGHNDQKIRFWDSRGPRCTQIIPVQDRVTSLSLSHDQLHLLSCSRDDTLKVIDLRASNVRQVFRAEGFKCGSDWTKAVFSPDRSYALAGSWDGALYIWDVDTGRLESRLRGPHGAAVNAVAWCYSGSHVVSVDQGRKVVLWH